MTVCIVRTARIYPDVRTLKTKGAVSEGRVRFFLENIECAVYPRGAPGLEQTRRVRRALLYLQAQHHK